MERYGDSSWHQVCKNIPNKSEIKCFKRWIDLKEGGDSNSLSQKTKNQSWTPEEDKHLKDLVEKLGT